MPAKRGAQPAVPKLNLMPPYIAAAKRLTAAIIGTAVMVVLVLLGMGLWWQSNASVVARLEQDLQQKTQQANEVRQKQEQAEKIRMAVQTLSNRLAILDDIRQSGKQIADLVRQIAAWVPEGVRLTALQFQAGGAPGGAMMSPAGMPGAPMGMPGAPSMVGPEAAEMPGMGRMGAPTPTAAGGTQINAVTLIGYTQSLYRLADFYSHLSQSDLFTNVQLELFEWNGRPYQGGNLPPILPKPATGKKEIGQGGPTTTPPGGTAPAATPGAVPAPGMGAPAMGAHGGSPAPAGVAGMGAHGGPSPSAPPAGMPAMGMMPMAGAGAMPGITTGAAIVRDPTAPRNAVYFVIRATLKAPLSIAPKLHAASTAGAMGAGAPGAMPPGAMAPGAPTPPAATPSPGGATSGGEEEAASRGLGRRRLGGEE